MSPIAENDLFLGTWQLQPEQSKYELGQPPLEGLYNISREEGGYVFEIAWKTTEGQQFEISFSGIPDGQQYPYENPQIAEALSMTRVDEFTLDSESFKDGKRIAHARRDLIENGRGLRVTQTGERPDGAFFSNVSYYRKLV